MPADIQVNTAQNGVWEYCFLRETCRGSSQLSLPLRQIPALMISILQIQKTFCVSTGKWPFTSLRNKCNRDKKKRGKKVSGICRAAKARRRISSASAILKTCLAQYSEGFILELIALAYVTFLVLMQQVWTFVTFVFMLVLMLMSQCKPGRLTWLLTLTVLQMSVQNNSFVKTLLLDQMSKTNFEVQMKHLKVLVKLNWWWNFTEIAQYF